MTEAKSAQPQLPPRPKYMRPRNFDPADFVFGYEETNKYMKALEAENESLKAQLEERNNRGTGFLYVPKAAYEVVKAERDKYKNKADQLRIAFVLSDVILPAEFEPTLPPTKRLHAYVDQALEVIREYRKSKANHLEDCEDYSKWDRGQHSYRTHFEDDRCPACIKADALLAKEGQ